MGGNGSCFEVPDDTRLASAVTVLITKYGLWLVAAAIAVGCICIPVPGETILITTAIYAGRKCGDQFLMRCGGYLGLTESRIRMGQSRLRTADMTSPAGAPFWPGRRSIRSSQLAMAASRRSESSVVTNEMMRSSPIRDIDCFLRLASIAPSSRARRRPIAGVSSARSYMIWRRHDRVRPAVRFCGAIV